MPEGFIDKIKRTVIQGSQTAAGKVEETARLAKVKLDLIAEENRLNKKYSDLGEKAYEAIQAGSTGALAEDPAASEIIKAIGENLVRIQENKAKLKALQESCCEK